MRSGGCLLDPSQQGLLFSAAGGATTQLTSGYAYASLAASGSQLLATWSECGGVSARRFDAAGAPLGGALQLASPPAITQQTATFDGADFAVAWKTQRAATIGVEAGWVSPAGAVAFAAPDPAAMGPIPEDFPSIASFGGGAALLATRAGASVEARILTKGVGPTPAGISGPPVTFPDGQFGPMRGYRAPIAASGGDAMILSIDDSGSLMGSLVTGQLQVTGRATGMGVDPGLSIASSGAGFLGALSDGGSMAIRRFAADGTPADASWTPLPYRGGTGIAATFDGTSYQLTFGGGDLSCNAPSQVRRLSIPATGALGSLLGAAVIPGPTEVSDASCWGSACVGVSRGGGQDLFLLGPGGPQAWSPPGVGTITQLAVAMGPTGGLLAIGASSGKVYGQPLDAAGTPQGALMSLGIGMSAGWSPPILATVWDGQRFAVAWQTGGTSANIEANWVLGGAPMFPTGQLLVDETDAVLAPKLAPAGNGQAFLTYGWGILAGSRTGTVKRVDPAAILACQDSVPMVLGPEIDIGSLSGNGAYTDAKPTGSGALVVWKEKDAQGYYTQVRATRVDLAGTPLDVPPVNLGQAPFLGAITVAASAAGFVVYAFDDTFGGGPKSITARKLDAAGQPAGPWVTVTSYPALLSSRVPAGFDGVDHVLAFGVSSVPHLLRVDPNSLAPVSDKVLLPSGNVKGLACDPPGCFVYYSTGFAAGFKGYLEDEDGTSVLVEPAPSGSSTSALFVQATGPTVAIAEPPMVYAASFTPALASIQNPVFQFASPGPSLLLWSAADDDVSILTYRTIGGDGYVRADTPGACDHAVPQGGNWGKLIRLASGNTMLLFVNKADAKVHVRMIQRSAVCQGPADCPSGSCVAGVCCASSCEDGETCTADTCAFDGQTCNHVPVTDGTPCAGGTCFQGACAQSTGTGGVGGAVGTGGVGGAAGSGGVGGTAGNGGVGGVGGNGGVGGVGGTAGNGGVGGVGGTAGNGGVGGVGGTAGNGGVGGVGGTAGSGGVGAAGSGGVGGVGGTAGSGGVGGTAGNGGVGGTAGSGGVGTAGSGGVGIAGSGGVGGATATTSLGGSGNAGAAGAHAGGSGASPESPPVSCGCRSGAGESSGAPGACLLIFAFASAAVRRRRPRSSRA